MNGIFEGAKFGDRFICRDGALAVFIDIVHSGDFNQDFARLIDDVTHKVQHYCLDGKKSFGDINRDSDIVSKYLLGTIKNRAEEYTNNYENIEYWYDGDKEFNDVTKIEQAFIKGATEQLEIDIKRAYEYLKANIPSFRDDQLLEDFVEAMKGD